MVTHCDHPIPSSHHHHHSPPPPSSAPVNAHIWATPGRARRHAHDPRPPRHKRQPAATSLPPRLPFLDNDNRHVTAPFDPQHHHIAATSPDINHRPPFCVTARIPTATSSPPDDNVHPMTMTASATSLPKVRAGGDKGGVGGNGRPREGT